MKALQALFDRSSRARRRSEEPAYGAEDVAEYYQDFTDSYLKSTGEFIQAFRSWDTDELMRYMVASMALEDGMRLLDAGCGVGGPAFWIAEHFPKVTITCVTNSARQHEVATEKLKSRDFRDRVTFVHGDYHELPRLCGSARFDLVMFLESLGHAHDPGRVLGGAAAQLVPSGKVYIKDFFRRASTDPAQREAIGKVIDVINRAYRYNVKDVATLVAALGDSGFNLEFARRPEIAADIAITQTFEDACGRLTYPAMAEVWAVDWYEVLATRN